MAEEKQGSKPDYEEEGVAAAPVKAEAAEVVAEAVEPEVAAPVEAKQRELPLKEEAPGLLEWAKGAGVDLGSDEEEAKGRLLAAYQQQRATEQYQPYVRAYLEHAGEFQQWMTERAKAEQEKAAKQPDSWWKPPASADEVQRLMAAHYERGADGQLKPRADAPLDAIQKVQQYAGYVQDWQYKLQHSPVEALAPFIQQQVQPLIQQALGQYAGQFQEQAKAQQIISQHSDWMFQKAEDGTTTYGQNGQPLLSEAGALFRDYVARAAQMGVRDVAQQEHYALSMVEADLVRKQGQPAKQEENKRRFVQQHNRMPNVGGANGKPVVERSAKGLSLAELLRSDLQEAGLNDASVAERQR